MDYENITTEILLFASCQRRSCINVTIEDDNALELVELFNVTLETTTGLDERISLSPVNGVVEIIDNDGMLTSAISTDIVITTIYTIPSQLL